MFDSTIYLLIGTHSTSSPLTKMPLVQYCSGISDPFSKSKPKYGNNFASFLSAATTDEFWDKINAYWAQTMEQMEDVENRTGELDHVTSC